MRRWYKSVDPTVASSARGHRYWRATDCTSHSDDLRTETLMYQAVTRNIEVTVSPRFLPERSSIEKSLLFLGLYHRDQQPRHDHRPAQDPPLAHHRRVRPLAGGARRRRGRRGAGAASPAHPSNIPAACRCRRRPASWSGPTAWSRPKASVSTSPFRRFRSTARKPGAP